LINPVKGASNKSIGSFYGDPRDAGKRKHEGIDIFAPKGTPVLAPADGVVAQVGNSKLGGKTVWMNDVKRGHSYYFAHLDSQMVRTGKKVKQGDVLGTVGNTGNAKYTPSHLHFGVYQRTSKDPIAYIRTMEKLVNEITPDTLFQSLVFRVNKKHVALHSGPSKKLATSKQLNINEWVKVIAQSNLWYRVVTAGQAEGFVEKSNLIAAEKGTRLTLKKETMLLSAAESNATPMGTLSGTVESLARFGAYRFVRTTNGALGWIDGTDL